MYVLLTGTKKNAGDFLIAHAAKRLFGQFAPHAEHMELPSWQPIDEHLEQINSAKALVLCGGPSYQASIGKRGYPILDVLGSVKVPIISFGLGWKGNPGDDYDVKYYGLPASAEPLLERLRSDFKYAGCRDYLTWRVLRRYGFKNALMTGCPSWYDPDHFNHGLVVPSKVSRIVFTPAEWPAFRSQSVAMMQVTRELFEDAQIVCSFHRGWEADEHTDQRHAENARQLKAKAEELGMETQDVSESVDGILGYEQFDLHVGYRVHAHLRMLSVRKPSFLIAEDGRGRGVLEAMGLNGVTGWKTPLPLRLCNRCLPNPTIRRATRIAFRRFSVNPLAPEQLRWLITEEVQGGFGRFKGAIAVIEETWERMHRMLRELPS